MRVCEMPMYRFKMHAAGHTWFSEPFTCSKSDLAEEVNSVNNHVLGPWVVCVEQLKKAWVTR